MHIEASIFKAYDLRGVVPSTLKGMSKTDTTAAFGLLCCLWGSKNAVWGGCDDFQRRCVC
jgi:hypothetical protein